ncbi:phage antirepressor N-terminal domain-containing protein [Nonomuraea sp. NPDC049158]|uniref:phage antirepressor N-terminal domain-containing protein n=1 Tax=Nonomuraea sp. NPDC049158 TaxID=3155649 RepID=UPI0033EC59BE
MTEIAKMPFYGTFIHTVLVEGEPHVVIRPTILGIGLDYSTQLQKLKTRSWGRVGQNPTRDSAGRVQEMATVDLDTWSMLLANIDENKVKESVKDLVIKYQAESARALRKYWTEGGAINPRATVEQLDDLDRTIRRAKDQAAVLGNLKGVVDSAWLDAKGRHVAAIALGMEPDIDPATRPLTVGEFLENRGIQGASLRSMSTKFGKKLKNLYRDKYGTEPGTVDRFIDGALRSVAAYTEAHRDLFNQAWVAMLDTV